MHGIRRILAAVRDPGALVLPAVAKATQLARAFGAELELFHAIDAAAYVGMLGSNVSGLQQMEDEERRGYLQRLERIAARARLHTPVVTVAAEWDYPAYEAIVRRALVSGADLLVAECSRGRHFAQALLRLADWELLRLCPLPVLLVKQAHPYRRPTIVGAVDPGLAFGKSAMLDEQILRLGAQVARALEGALHAVHAYEAPASSARTLAAAVGSATAEPDAASAELGLQALIRRSDVSLAGCHLLGGEPSTAVAEVARRRRADIVVAGAVARAGLERALVGNTAERLLRFLPCDLLVLKPPEFVCRVPAAQRTAPRISAPSLS